MHIERIQVEEGFLDGLDISFAQGLNVIIGERGTGKTSLIELIRFCLGVKGYTEQSTKRSLDHALSILGSGQVTITLIDGKRRLLVTRTASDDSPRASEPYTRPLIFSQTEIETVGLQAQGRIELLDSFRSNQKDMENVEFDSISEVRSLSAETEDLRREVDNLTSQIEEIPVLDKQIAELAPQEQKLAKVSAAAKKKKNQLDRISVSIASCTVSIDAIERFKQSVSRWQSMLSSVLSSAPTLEPWPGGGGEGEFVNYHESVQQVKDNLSNAITELQEVVTKAETQLQTYLKYKLDLEDDARQLRKDIEALQEGAGAIVRQGQQLRERKAQLESLKAILAERQRALETLLKQRGVALDRLDSIRQNRFIKRNEAATELIETLGPRIRVKVTRAGQFEVFAAAIADALRGSGLQYNELSYTLAANVSPRELLEATDSNDFHLIAEATGITKDRALRTLSHLRDANLGVLATVSVEDLVTFQLLDGSEYKSIGKLSTGQRCTVVLPLVLQHIGRVLIVDQPEDHIDNAFIADTLIVSILARGDDSQLIFSTHNANIPVLGNADRVIQLGSDGRRGFSVLSSTLDDSSVVEAITTIMEGGSEAFQERARFYRQYEKL